MMAGRCGYRGPGLLPGTAWTTLGARSRGYNTGVEGANRCRLQGYRY